MRYKQLLNSAHPELRQRAELIVAELEHVLGSQVAGKVVRDALNDVDPVLSGELNEDNSGLSWAEARISIASLPFLMATIRDYESKKKGQTQTHEDYEMETEIMGSTAWTSDSIASGNKVQTEILQLT